GIRSRNVTGVQTCALPISKKFANKIRIKSFVKILSDSEPIKIVFISFNHYTLIKNLFERYILIRNSSSELLLHEFLFWCNYYTTIKPIPHISGRLYIVFDLFYLY